MNQALESIPEDTGGEFELTSKLYGRSREVHTLLAAFRRAAAGSSEAVMLGGPAGIGKTAVAHQLRDPIGAQRGYFITGKFDQLQRDVPFTAVVSALQELVQQLLAENTTNLARWRAAITASLGRNGRVITDVLPSLELLIGPQPPLPEIDPVESQNRFNLVFQNFVQVFCRREHPLVVFIDDMQWADAASLQLLGLILSAPDTESLLVVASYRDNEVTPTHPFIMTMKEIERRSVPIEAVTLKPLGWADVLQLLSDSLRLDERSATPLAAAVREKTAGNPYFIRQFLQRLHADRLLTFDTTSNSFRFDLDAIQRAAITENVADLIAQKIGRLDVETQRMVRIAAAIGNRFDLDTLARVADQSPESTAARLQPALRESLIVAIPPLETVNPELAHVVLMQTRYAFQHDRVQQAAYALIPQAARAALNLSIGCTMLAAAGTNNLRAEIFDIVNHVNQGIALIDSRTERLRMAGLNLQAAGRARNSTAYDVAERCCRAVLELLDWDAWGAHYQLTLDTHAKLAECLTLMGNFDGAFRAIDEALPHASSASDRGRLQTLKTHAFLCMGDMAGSVACGRDAARMFGLHLPEQPDDIRAQLQHEVGAIIGLANERGIESFLELPLMKDNKQMALMSLLMHCIPPAYQTQPELFALICCKMVRLSIEHGNCAGSAKGYGSFAVILSGVVGNFRDADRFGKLGVDLSERLNDITVRSACYFTWAAFASLWSRPIDESIQQYQEGVRWGLQSGDHPHAAYCAARAITHTLFRGAPLAATRVAASESLQLLYRVKDSTNVPLLRSRMRLIDWLQDDGTSVTLDGPKFEEHVLLAEMQAPGASKSLLSHFQSLRVMHRYLAGDFATAHELSRQSANLLPYSTAMITVAEHTLYQALTLTALHGQASPSEREEFDTLLQKHHSQLQVWAENCPQTFEHLQLLVGAERARVAERAQEAAGLYDRAIKSAASHGFLNIVALANELGSRFHRAQRDEIGVHVCLGGAIQAYTAWGAHGKARALSANAARGL